MKEGGIARATLAQAKAAVANAQATLNKANAADDLAKTQEKIALTTQRADAAAISSASTKVAEATLNADRGGGCTRRYFESGARPNSRQGIAAERHRAIFQPFRPSWTRRSSISTNAR